MNDAGMRRGKEKERATKAKMDEIHEVTGMKLAELRDNDRKEVMEEACYGGR